METATSRILTRCRANHSVERGLDRSVTPDDSSQSRR